MTGTATEEALIIQGSDGAVYAIPCSQLEWYRVQNDLSEVNGYGDLNPQPLPPGPPPPDHYKALGFSTILFSQPTFKISSFNVSLAGGFRTF